MADPIRIGAPDGSIIEFPAGTSDDTIKSVMAKNFPAPAAPKEESGGILKSIDNGVRALANGMTFGLADRFAAGAGALTGVGGNQGDYAGNLKAEQDKTDQFASEHPVVSAGLNIAGGAAVPVGAVGAAAKGASLGAKTLFGLGAGAGIGGVQGALSSRDFTDIPQTAEDALKGAAVGAATGAVIPGASKVIGSGITAVADALRGGVNGVSRGAAKELIAAAKADGIPAVQAQMARLGPDATLADAGPAFLGKAQGASLNSDEGRSILQGVLTARNEGTNARIMGDVNQALGPAEDPQTVTNAIREYRSGVDNQSYPAALNNALAVQTAPILTQISSAIESTPPGTMERKALENLRNMLTVTEKPENNAASAVASKASAPAPADIAAAQHAKNVADIRAKFGDAVAAAYDRQNQSAAAPQAQSLLQFLASKGGLGPDAELEAIGAHNHVVNVDGAGRRKLVRQGGFPLDYAREAAEEAGYLRGDHNGTSTVNDLLDAIDGEMRGQKRYPEGYEGFETRREGAARSEREQAEYDRHVQGFEDDLANAGHGELAPDVRQRAVSFMANQGMDADTAVEHALRQIDNEEGAAAGAFPGDRSPPAQKPAVATQRPQSDARILHKVKQELDNVIEYNTPGLGVPAGALQNQQGALKRFRGLINSTLEEQVPGYRAANRSSAALAKRAEAVESGTQMLSSGKTAPSPERFASEFGQMQPGEQIAFAKGNRGEIARLLGTKINDLQALRQALQGEGGWNTAKLATVYGQDAADQLTGSVDRNLKFRDTYNKVVENSQTAQRQAAASAMKPTPASETPLINPNMSATGLVATGAKKAAIGVANALLRRDPTQSYGEVARVLSASGAQRDRYIQAIADALTRRQSHAAAAPKVGDRAALIAAILGNAYVQGSPMRRRQEQQAQ